MQILNFTKIYSLFIIFSLTFVLFGCATNQTMPSEQVDIGETTVTPETPKKKADQFLIFKTDYKKKCIEPLEPVAEPVYDLQVIGQIEPVFIENSKGSYLARIDTGATTSSLHAYELVYFERDGKPWVRFKTSNKMASNSAVLEKRITRIAKIKQHTGISQKRPVVKLKVRFGATVLYGDFNLTNRADFKYPALIGRNILQGNFLVNVSKKNTTSAMQESN